ncbi:LuxR C-terminal-related transcriptional regulator [Alistipes finegoldii]|uniref:LuxR C-terminal-related transcriptional regulator n=1 Tax=Alistipes finegoldii TaxID=214856 RepID=UPI00248CAF7B|nr:LuxR C-terminal-related transcriptional regulator [Alistipes finegoldii]
MSVSLPKISITIGNDQHKSRGSLRLLSIGFALQLAWFFSALFGVGIPFSPAGALDDTATTVPLSLIICFGVALFTLLFIAATERRMLRLYTSRRLVIVFALLCSAGTLALFGLEMEGGLGLTYNIVSGLLTGVGSAGLILLWGVAYSRVSATTIVMNTAVSVTAAIVMNALIVHVLAYPIAGIVIAALPLIELPFLWASTPKSFTERHEEPIFERPKLRRGAFCAHTIPSLLLFGFGLGAMAQVVSHVIILNDDTVSLLLSLFAGSFIVLTALIAIFSADKGNHWGFLFRPLLPAIMLTMFCIPVLMVGRSPIAAVAVLAGFLCFAALMWIFLGLVCQEYRPSPFFVFGVGCSALAVGAVGGWFLIAASPAIDPYLLFGKGGTAFIIVAVTIVAYGLYPRVAEVNRVLVPTASDAHPATEAASESVSESQQVPSAPDTFTVLPTSPDAMESEESTPSVPAAYQAPSPTFIPPVSAPFTGPYQPYFPAAQATPAPVPLGTTSSSSMESTFRYAESRMDIYPNAAQPYPTPQKTSIIPSTPSEDHTADQFRHHCDEIADSFSLSRREREVMQLLARGHNASYIQQKLCISRSTAKTHITHIYRKLDIHTQQELLTMVNDSDEA